MAEPATPVEVDAPTNLGLRWLTVAVLMFVIALNLGATWIIWRDPIMERRGLFAAVTMSGLVLASVSLAIVSVQISDYTVSASS